MKKVLITGGAGFIGLHLAEKLLNQGCTVDLVDNFSRGARDTDLERVSANKSVRLFSRDLLAPGALNGIDNDYTMIYHLAAIVGVANVLEKPFVVLKDNTLLLLNMIDFARTQKRLQRLVFASTSEVYAGTLKHFTMPVPTPEATPLALTELEHPRTSYMLSKIYGEALCQQAGIPFTIVRPHNVFGPRMGMQHVIPELLLKAHRAQPGATLEVASADHKRTFCYIDDAVNLIVRAAEAPECVSQTLNIGNQEPEISIRALTEIILEVTGKKLVIREGAVTPGSPVRRCPDMTKTIRLTGFKPQIALRDGIERTFQWYVKA